MCLFVEVSAWKGSRGGRWIWNFPYARRKRGICTRNLRFAQDENYQTSLSFRPHEGILKIDRKFSGSRRAIIHQRRCLVSAPNAKKGELKVRIILDRFSVEVFVNDGEQVMTAVFYTDQAADGISFFADGTVSMDIVKYDLCR